LRDIIDKHDHTTTFNDAWDCASSRFERLRNIIDKHNHTTMFNDAWDCAPGRFERLCDIIDKHDHTTTFNDTWDCAPGQFECLRSFCGELATMLTNTTFVESYFSILKWELDENRTTFMHLSLEEIFQTKQPLVLQTLLR
jgi:hypothetical protein